MIEVDRFKSVEQPEGFVIIDIKSMYLVGFINKWHKDKVNVILHALQESYGARVKVDKCQCGQYKPIEWAKCYACNKPKTSNDH